MHKLDHARMGLFLGNGGLSIGYITCTWLLRLLSLPSAPDALVGRLIAGRVCFLRIFIESLLRIFELLVKEGIFYLSLSSV